MWGRRASNGPWAFGGGNTPNTSLGAIVVCGATTSRCCVRDSAVLVPSCEPLTTCEVRSS